MSNIRNELIKYGIKIAEAGLVAGAGGNISARDGNIIWMKPSGFAMDDMVPSDLCGMALATGKQVRGTHAPTSEVNMHLGIYRTRPDTQVVFHVHSPWASGVISSGAKFKPMFAEFIFDLGRVGTVPYIMPSSQELADAVTKASRTCDTIFMENHGTIALGATMKQAYNRCRVVEDSAKSMIAAAIVGKPRFLTPKQQQALLALKGAQHRIRVMSR